MLDVAALKKVVFPVLVFPIIPMRISASPHSGFRHARIRADGSTGSTGWGTFRGLFRAWSSWLIADAMVYT